MPFIPSSIADVVLNVSRLPIKSPRIKQNVSRLQLVTAPTIDVFIAQRIEFELSQIYLTMGHLNGLSKRPCALFILSIRLHFQIT